MPVIVLTGSGTWSLPADWNDNVNTIEVIGPGGNGANGASGTSGGGGGGGGYVKATNVPLAAAIAAGKIVDASNVPTNVLVYRAVTVAPARFGRAIYAQDGQTGDYYYSDLLVGNAGSAASGSTGGSGGFGSNSGIHEMPYTVIGRTGGAGGSGRSSSTAAGGGGGGAAGPDGNGASGGANSTTSSTVGRGGGGANGGTAGSGTAATAGTGVNGGGNGGAGGSASSGSAGAAGNGTTVYSGGGGGGAADGNAAYWGGNGGGYGGGGGGAGSTAGSQGGAGASGVIIITYTPVGQNYLQATEGSDTAQVTGKVFTEAVLSPTEGADTAYFSRAKRIVLIPTIGGSTSFTLPSDWTDAGSVIEVYGRGGRGGDSTVSGGGGGGGGAYLRITGSTYPLKSFLANGSLTTLNYSDSGSSTGGGFTIFGTHDFGSGISVQNGIGGSGTTSGSGGIAANGVASFKYFEGPEYAPPQARFSGGAGGAGRTSASAGGGGGGGGAGPSGDGGAGGANTTATGGIGGSGGISGGGFAGQGGVGGNDAPPTPGAAGENYGGGGGGAYSQAGATGGSGGTGAIILTYFPSPSNYMAAGEASGDTLTASGAVTNTSGVLGSITATEAGDTISASGRVRVTGSLLTTEAGDTISASGRVRVSGALTVSESAKDAAAASGKVLVRGSLTAAETGADAAAVAGRVAVKGTLAGNEGADTFAAVSASPGSVSGSMSAQELADTITFAGKVRVRGTLAVLEAADTCAAAGVIRVRGALNVIEAGNDSFIAISLSAVHGAMSAVETTADTASIRHQAASSYLGSIATLHPDVRAAFRQRLTALSGLVDSRSWEGRPFAPAKGVPWLRESVRPISSVVRGVGSGGIVEHRVVATVTLFWPSSNSLLEQELQAGSILGHFPPGLRITYGSSTATVVQAERGPLLQEPDWRSCNVTLTLTAHTIGNA